MLLFSVWQINDVITMSLMIFPVTFESKSIIIIIIKIIIILSNFEQYCKSENELKWKKCLGDTQQLIISNLNDFCSLVKAFFHILK